MSRRRKVRELRDAQARRFTKEEVPFVTGIRKDVRAAFAERADPLA